MLIAEVSEKYEISADTLRYYERVGLIPPVTRKSNGIRDYNEEDCGWVEFVKCMRHAGLQIETLIEYVGLVQQGNTTVEARKHILIEQREQLIERIEHMQATVKRLEMKIENYDKTVGVAEKNLKKNENTQ